MTTPTLLVLGIAAGALLVFWLSRASGGGSIEDFEAWLARGATIVDVRTPGEFASGHDRDALNIPHHEIGARCSELGAPGPVVVYCRSGMRSRVAAATLKAKGYDVLDMGGIRSMPRGRQS